MEFAMLSTASGTQSGPPPCPLLEVVTAEQLAAALGKTVLWIEDNILPNVESFELDDLVYLRKTEAEAFLFAQKHRVNYSDRSEIWISADEAAEFTGKSIATLNRAAKSENIKKRKEQNRPIFEQNSLARFYKIDCEADE